MGRKKKEIEKEEKVEAVEKEEKVEAIEKEVKKIEDKVNLNLPGRRARIMRRKNAG